MDGELLLNEEEGREGEGKERERRERGRIEEGGREEEEKEKGREMASYPPMKVWETKNKTSSL